MRLLFLFNYIKIGKVKILNRNIAKSIKMNIFTKFFLNIKNSKIIYNIVESISQNVTIVNTCNPKPRIQYNDTQELLSGTK